MNSARLRSVVVLCGLLPLLAGPATGGDSDAAAAGVQVTYLANEGFLLEAGDTKVLVDALTGDGLRGYPVVPAEIRADLEAARGRFAGVDLILASHYHGDHFDAAAVARHLRANPRAIFLSTHQAAAKLRSELGGSAAAFEIVGTLPAEGDQQRFDLGGVTIDALNLHHGRGRQPPVENLGFVIRLGGLDLLHVGDTEAGAADLEPYTQTLAAVDVWLLPDWLLGEPAWRAVWEGAESPGRRIAMHLPAATAPPSWFGSARTLEGRLGRIREALPDSWIPLEPLESRHYPSRQP